MVRKNKIEGKECYQCEECLLYYENKKLSKKCEQWCKTNRSCNLLITKYALKINKILEKYQK